MASIVSLSKMRKIKDDWKSKDKLQLEETRPIQDGNKSKIGIITIMLMKYSYKRLIRYQK